MRRNLGVYVHIPFCLNKCRYCDFVSFAGPQARGEVMEAYVRALILEIKRAGEWSSGVYGGSGRRVDTVFIGGGTPTSLPSDQLSTVIEAIRSGFEPVDDAEITVEANPDTLSAGYLTALRQAGVNRLSVGIQATRDRHLRFMGRTHRWERTRAVLMLIRACGIRNYSFDLIYGVPGITAGEIRGSINLLIAFRPVHISAYELTPEPHTPYTAMLLRHPSLSPAEAVVVDQQRLVERRLSSCGLYRYEVSNYARPGYECRHNLRYWRGGDYIGVGLNAASRIGEAVVNNPAGMAEYLAWAGSGGLADRLAGLFSGYIETGGGLNAAPGADLFMQLRTRKGIQLPGSAGHSGHKRQKWLADGLVRYRHGWMEPTPKGLSYADMLAREL